MKTSGFAAILLLTLLFVSACSVGGEKFTYLPPTVESRPAVDPAPPGGWLEHLNYYRAAACLSPVTENAASSDGDRKHAICIVKADALLQHGEDPDATCYTREGQIAAQQSNLFNGYDLDATDCWVIDTWMQSPFHAVGVLDPRLAQAGFGSYRETRGNPRTGAALNVIAGINPAAAKAYPIFWPGDGTTMPINRHWGGYPSPLTSCPGYTLPSGLPLILQIGSGELTPVVTATSFTQEGKALEHCVFDETSYRNPDRAQQRLGRSILGARDAIVLIPRSPLTSGTAYTASITANGRAYTWSFAIGSGSAPALAGRGFAEFNR